MRTKLEAEVQKISANGIKDKNNQQIGLVKKLSNNKDILCFKNANSEFLMDEIGILRKESFTLAGAKFSSNLKFDIDEHDTNSDGYYQIILWDNKTKMIDGAYRYKLMNPKEIQTKITPFASSPYFIPSKKFVEEYSNKTIELGRSFINVNHLTSRSGFGMLKNLWQLVGAIYEQNQHIDYFFGKITFYPEKCPNLRFPIYRLIKSTYKDEFNLFNRPSNVAVDENQDIIEASKKRKSNLFKGMEEEIYYAIKQKSDELKKQGMCEFKAIETAKEKLFKVNMNKLKSQAKNESINPLAANYVQSGKIEGINTFGPSKNLAFGNTEELGLLMQISKLTDNTLKTYFPQKFKELYSQENKSA